MPPVKPALMAWAVMSSSCKTKHIQKSSTSSAQETSAPPQLTAQVKDGSILLLLNCAPDSWFCIWTPFGHQFTACLWFSLLLSLPWFSQCSRLSERDTGLHFPALGSYSAVLIATGQSSSSTGRGKSRTFRWCPANFFQAQPKTICKAKEMAQGILLTDFCGFLKSFTDGKRGRDIDPM